MTIPKSISDRHKLANRVAKVICNKGLTNPHGGVAARVKDSQNRSVYSVAFSKPQDIDGTVVVYSDHFLLVRYQTRYKTLPARGNIVFKSENELTTFLDSIPS